MNLRATLCSALATVMLWGGYSFAGPNEGLLENPAPTAAFKGYSRYAIAPITMQPPFAGQAPNEKAVAKIQTYVDAQLKPVLTAWSTAGEASGAKGTLLMEPEIQSIKFIGGSTRFWVGALAGSSYVVLKLKISEQDGGKVLADPEFFQRAAAMSGAWTVGGQDNDMLQRIVTVAMSYLTTNYEVAVGGNTGRAAPKPAK